MKLTKSTLQQIIREEVTKIVSSDAILALEQFETSSGGSKGPGSWSGNRDGEFVMPRVKGMNRLRGDCPPGTNFVRGKGCVDGAGAPAGDQEEVRWYDVEKGHETMADRKFADRPGDIEGAGADRDLAYMMQNLGTLDDVGQVLKLVAEDLPEFTERFQHYYDYLVG